MAQTVFSEIHVPVLWEALTLEYGSVVTYLPDHDEAQAFPVTVIWKEGAEDEPITPGRYSSAWVRHADFDAVGLPRMGDGVSNDVSLYDVVRVDAIATGYSRLVLQENNG